jgi:hypothetical protein
MQPSILSAAEDLVLTTALDVQEDPSEPWDLCKLRRELASDRERLERLLADPEDTSAGFLGLNELFWKLRFSWADVQDYVEEANAREKNLAAGFPDVPYHWEELPDGSSVPCRAQIHRQQTLHDYMLWAQAEEYPISAWDEEDYAAAVEVDEEEEDEEERIPWEDYDQDDLRKMDRALARGY